MALIFDVLFHGLSLPLLGYLTIACMSVWLSLSKIPYMLVPHTHTRTQVLHLSLTYCNNTAVRPPQTQPRIVTVKVKRKSPVVFVPVAVRANGNRSSDAFAECTPLELRALGVEGASGCEVGRVHTVCRMHDKICKLFK